MLFDNDSVDINDKDAFHMLSIQTRVRANITGPDALGAKTSGMIETEFFGTSEADLNGLRLRHAFIKLNWKKTELLMGQFWHPMFPVNAIPGTISFNTGAPFIPFSRNPQIKVSHNLISALSIKLTAYGERDFVSTGPDGLSNKYLRNSALPGLNGELVLKLDSISFMLTGGMNYQSIVPEIKTNKGFYTDQSLSAISYFSYAEKKIKNFSLKVGGVYAQNAHNVTMIGGYAIADTIDKTKGYKKYTPYTTLSVWTDISLTLKKWQMGLYGGYAKNMGTSQTINGKVFARGSAIDYLYRVSPRISYIQNKLTLAAEVELTNAAYGRPQKDGTVVKTHEARNIRFLFAAIYNF